MKTSNADLGLKPRKISLFEHCQWGRIIVLSLSLGGFLGIGGQKIAIAQITPDNSLGAESATVTSNVNFKNQLVDLIQGGAIREDKLFMSFQELNVSSGQNVYFAHPANVTQILSRVTGNNTSQINGLLGVTGNADLFLFNPNGVIFGAGARLDITGSLSVSATPGFTTEEIVDNGNAANSPLQINVPLGLQRATPNSTIVNHGNLAVGGNIVFNAAILELQGSLIAGGDMDFFGSEIFIGDRPDRPTIFNAGGRLTLHGGSIHINLTEHEESGILTRDAIVFIGTQDITIAGLVGTLGGDDSNVSEDNGIAIESATEIQVQNALLMVLRGDNAITLQAPSVNIDDRSAIVAEAIAINTESLSINQASQLIASAVIDDDFGEIDIDAGKKFDIKDSRIVLDTLTGSIKIVSDRIFVDGSAIRSQTRQGSTRPQIIMQGLSLALHDSAIVTEVPNLESVSDIKFDIEESIVLDNSEISGAGDVTIRTKNLVVSPDSTITSGRQVNVEIVPVSGLPTREDIPAIAPFSPANFPTMDDDMTGTLIAAVDFEFNDPVQQGGESNNTDISLHNSCVAENDKGEKFLRGITPHPIRPSISVFPSDSNEAEAKIPIAYREALGFYRLANGRGVLSRPCPYSAANDRGFFS